MNEMCGLNGRVVMISLSQEGYRDRITMTLYYGGLHPLWEDERRRKWEAVGKNPRQGPAIMWKQTTEPCCTSPLPFHDPVFSKVYGRDILETPMIRYQWKASGILPKREVTSHLCHSQDLHRNITSMIFKTCPNLSLTAYALDLLSPGPGYKPKPKLFSTQCSSVSTV